VRFYKISVKDKKITRLTNNTDCIGNWSVSKDGKYVAAIHEKSLHYTFDQKVVPVTILHNLADGTESRFLPKGVCAPMGSSGRRTIPDFTHGRRIRAIRNF
jgi:hypothetical protein